MSGDLHALASFLGGGLLALAIIAAGIAACAYRWGLLPVADLGAQLRDGGRR